ncbi:molybdopterin-guanine dinucleotide biosynthesis protein B [Bacillus sp. FSL W8-0920]|uniref:molybdopterin-guanine dinucleotide biosynthesis protein B n=1 Tax=Bacillus TaxID=1386 RepID=UPI0010BF2B71|nr:molybdopterin-guanine dinucleotide biosynthesis protein B [Bacillus pumilus]MBR0589805.1 molybdopterin-guanine dinucleotide biosynthesis protein B [Bacillus pumilus sxm20-2]MDR0121457.1 molybdopterin-guanine dinucleotide biosynthesis protein B [Bacillus pumilus]MED1529299.1 molybdopterin-guanine dinucleotide biosynthesis protein B [Bacillus pumilus]TKI24566.1 molybdopterin-guanine dinucleotide biosynthesis protein B [Bacillus pumilus]
MLDDTLSILQVVGYQNSGKTSLIEKLCQLAVLDELKLGCFKHHGHGGKPDRLLKEKDTDRYVGAGAFAAGVEGEGEFHFSMQHITLKQLLNMCQYLPLDAVLIEGYKQAPYRKIVCVKNEEELIDLSTLSNIQAAIYFSQEFQLAQNYSFPVFSAFEKDANTFCYNLLKGGGSI